MWLGSSYWGRAVPVIVGTVVSFDRVASFLMPAIATKAVPVLEDILLCVMLWFQLWLYL